MTKIRKPRDLREVKEDLQYQASLEEVNEYANELSNV